MKARRPSSPRHWRERLVSGENTKVIAPTARAAKTAGLRLWMQRVLEECDHVSADFSADPVHDLRVVLRRCRSLVDGLIAMDPDPEWKAMKKAGKKLFQRLGALRDIQVMQEWLEKLELVPKEKENVERALLPAQPKAPQIHEEITEADTVSEPNRDSAAQALFKILEAREQEQKREAQSALQEFDRKQWQKWTRTLPVRASRIRSGSLVFKHLALERWTSARELHRVAMRNRSQVALHTLRIGIKRFRYIVENFLPEEHKLWGRDLKEIQDLLGDIHDLDVLWATASSCHIFPEGLSADDGSRQHWQERIREARAKRVERYHQKMVGPESLWLTWRAALPQGPQIQTIAASRMKLWAKALDPDFAHSERIAKFALALYDGLAASGLIAADAEARASLYIAALLHDVGKSEGEKGHHKASFDLIRAHGTPLGWTPEAMLRAAAVARFHRGALPTRSHKILRDLLPDEQKLTIQLSAILRLANAFDAEHDGQILSVKIEAQIEGGSTAKKRAHGFLRKPATPAKNEALVILADGYAPNSATAQMIAAERHLLETVLRRPVMVRATN